MKTEYRHFTPEERRRARQTDLAAFLQSRGEILKRSGSEWEWQNASQKITIRGHLWFHQYERVGGDAVDFVQKFYGLDYPKGVELLLGGITTADQASISANTRCKEKVFRLPPANDNLRCVYAYLVKTRSIDQEVLNAFVQCEMIYESFQYHNAVFVGFDSNGAARHAHKRGTGANSSYKGNAAGSDPHHSFHWQGQSERLYLFEAPIDMLSFLSLHRNCWQQHSYAAACCVGDQVLFQMLADDPKITTVYLCMDNDTAGQAANQRIAEKLLAKNISTKILVPRRKDWNEDLLCSNEMEETQCALSI